jgi:hypothetical protein
MYPAPARNAGVSIPEGLYLKSPRGKNKYFKINAFFGLNLNKTDDK